MLEYRKDREQPVLFKGTQVAHSKNKGGSKDIAEKSMTSGNKYVVLFAVIICLIH